jgi:hypothetical protein
MLLSIAAEHDTPQESIQAIARVVAGLDASMVRQILAANDADTTIPDFLKLNMLAGLITGFSEVIQRDFSDNGKINRDRFIAAIAYYEQQRFYQQALFALAIAQKQAPSITKAIINEAKTNETTIDDTRISFWLSILNTPAVTIDVFHSIYTQSNNQMENLSIIASIVRNMEYRNIAGTINFYERHSGSWNNNDYILKFGIIPGLSNRIKADCTNEKNEIDYHQMLITLRDFKDPQLSAQVLIGLSYTQVSSKHSPAPNKDVILHYLSRMLRSAFNDSKGMGDVVTNALFCSKLNPEVKAELRRLYMPRRRTQQL